MSATVCLPAKLADDFTAWYQASTFNPRKYSRCHREEKVVEASVTRPSVCLDETISHPINVPQCADKQTIYSNAYFSVRPSFRGGMGVFAVKDIQAEVVILKETPLMAGLRGTVDWMLATMTEEDQSKFKSLAAYEALDDNRSEAIFMTNQFAAGRGQGGGGAVYHVGSRFNHSCGPSALWSLNDLEIQFRTIRNVKQGEEITIHYGPSPAGLYSAYGFLCHCGHCLGYTEREAAAYERAWTRKTLRARECQINTSFSVNRPIQGKGDVQKGKCKQFRGR